MTYTDLASRLADDGADRAMTGADRTMTALPDGSVDVYYGVYGAGGQRLASRAEFADQLAGEETDTFALKRRSTEPGGQAVNMAQQAHALGDSVTLVGHLDDSVFDELPFETVSMGSPATMRIQRFDDEDVILAEPSTDIERWSLDSLCAVADIDTRLTADAVYCANWSSVDGMTDAFADLAERSLDGGVFVLDPGTVATRPRADVAELFETLGKLERSYDVVVSVNRREAAYAAEALSLDAGAEPPLASLRETADITAVVLHGKETAAVATGETTERVRNFDVDDPARHTGGGDRFGAGLAHALVRDWGWEAALALGNACASYYVETGDTGKRNDLRRFLHERADRE